jgi:hypothetical protein
MKYIKHFFLIISLFAVLACGSDGKYSAGDSDLACYSSKSDIYSSAVYNADSYSGGASRTLAGTWAVKFSNDNGTEIPEFQVSVNDGDYITLPDIRARHCFLTDDSRSGKILAGWNDSSGNYYTPGSSYKVSGSASFTAVWEEGVEIYSAAEFNDNIRDNLSGTYKLMRHIDLANIQSGTTALSYRPYQAGVEWIPIGNENEPFKGKLYGNGNMIDNLTIDNGTASVAGLFGVIGGKAEIYDLKINLAADGIKLTAAGKDKAVGALAGSILYDGDSNIIIKNVQTSGGKITADKCLSSGEIHAGGLAGEVMKSSPYNSTGADPKIIIDNVSNSVPVSVEVSESCNTSLGGFIGKGDNITVRAGANRGVVNVSTSSGVSGTAYAGGIAGHMEGNSSIDSCSNDSADNITAESNISSYSGGIVGYMRAGGSVKNSRNYDNVTANSNATSYSHSSNAGGIVGYVEGGTISNDNNTGNVEAKSTYIAYAGGIVGQMPLSGASATINNSSNTGAVRTESTGDAFSGGIAGNVYLSGAATATIDNCSNIGSDNISAVSKSTSSSYSVRSGGIVGSMEGGNGSIINSRNADNITATNTDGTSSSYAGGIAGLMYGRSSLSHKMENNDNTGDVTAISDSYAFAGGIAGNMTNLILIKNSHNADNVIAARATVTSYSGGIAGYVSDGGMIESSSNAGRVAPFTSGSAYAGGIAGYVTGTSSWIKNCGNTNNVTAESTSILSSDTVISGGVVGYIQNCDISNSYNAGTVSATATSNASYSGGIAGHMNNAAKVKNSYNRGEVTAISSGGTSYSGGIAGRMGPNASTITNSYNADNISSSGGVTGSGGILGYMDTTLSGTVTKCAAVNELVTGAGTTLKRIVGQYVNGTLVGTENFANGDMLIAGSTVADSLENGTGKTLSDLKDENTYEIGLSWSFMGDDDSPWYMPPSGSDYPYPILYWQNQ